MILILQVEACKRHLNIKFTFVMSYTDNIGALIIRIGFWGIYYTTILNRTPPHPK